MVMPKNELVISFKLLSLLKNNILHFLNRTINSNEFQLMLLKENTVQAAERFTLCCQKFKSIFNNDPCFNNKSGPKTKISCDKIIAGKCVSLCRYYYQKHKGIIQIRKGDEYTRRWNTIYK